MSLVSNLAKRVSSLNLVTIDQDKMYGDSYMKFTVQRSHGSVGDEPKLSVEEFGELDHVL